MISEGIVVADKVHIYKMVVITQHHSHITIPTQAAARAIAATCVGMAICDGGILGCWNRIVVYWS